MVIENCFPLYYNITMIKKRVLIWLFLLFVLPGGLCGDRDAGPVAELKEQFRIQDDGSTFFFKFPGHPVVDERGFVFVSDKDQALMFSPDGEFLKNLFSRGQGPNEMTDVNGIWPSKEHIIVSNRNPHKLIRFDRGGTPKKEVRVSEQVGFAELFTYYKGRFYYFKEAFRKTKNKAVYLDIKVRLLSVDPESGAAAVEKLWFPKKYFVMNTNWVMNVYFVQTGLAGDCGAFISYNGDYDIHRLDLGAMSLTPLVKKENYKKVKIKEAWKKILKPVRFPHYGPSGKEYRLFERKALDDVQRIWINGDKIWILTSTFDEKTRLVRVDVYDFNGVYKGFFRLPMPGGIHLFEMSYTRMSFCRGRLYIFETNEDGDLELACYRLLNIPAWAR
jgi:hypothetical protein